MDILQKCSHLKAKYQFGTDAHAFYMRSIIARYEDDYELEKQLVDQAIKLYPENLYFQERVNWHALPYFEKYEARKTPQLPEGYIPVAQEYRDQLTIVISGDVQTFNEIYECIESIKNSQYYHACTISVIGKKDFTQNQIDRLLDNFGVINFFDCYAVLTEYIPQLHSILEQPELIINSGDHRARLPIGYQFFKNRYIGVLTPTFANNIVDTKYFIHLESDIWLQDEQSLDIIFRKTLENNFSCVRHVSHSSMRNWFAPKMLSRNNILNVDLGRVLNKPYLSLGVYGMVKDCPTAMRWLELIKTLYQTAHPELIKLNHHFTEEWIFGAAVHETIPEFHRQMLEDYHAPYVDQKDIVLDQNHYLHWKGRLAGFPHCAGEKLRYYAFSVKRKLDNGSIVTSDHSLRYRDLPWRDKPQLEQIIKQEVL